MGDGAEIQRAAEVKKKSPSAEVLGRQLRSRGDMMPSSRFLQNRRQLLEIIARGADPAKSDKKKAEQHLQLDLAFIEPPDVRHEQGSHTLNRDEQRAYIVIVGEILHAENEPAQEVQELDRSEITEIILHNPQVFQAHYSAWKEHYQASQNNAKFKEQYPSLDDYVRACGPVFIEERKKEMIAARVVLTKKGPKANGLTSIVAEDLEKDTDVKKVLAYLDNEERYDELLTYGDMDESQKIQIYNSFIVGCGLQDLAPAQAEKLFEGIVGDTLAFYIADKKYEAAYVRMMEMVDYAEQHNLTIDPDEWNEQIEQAIYQNAKNALKESIEKAEASVYVGFSDSVDYSRPLEKPQDVANLAGVIIVGRGVNDDNIYFVRYPDSSVVTRMKIIPGSGKKKYDNATFAVYDSHPDAGKDNWTVIAKKQDLRSGFNRVLLGSLMYTDAVKKKGGIVDQDANISFNSEAVTAAASALYKGKKLGDIFITPQRRLMFENLMAILLKPDEGLKPEEGKTIYGDKRAFTVRLKVLQDLYGYSNKVEILRRVLLKPNAGSVHTISTLIAVIEQDQKEVAPDKKAGK